MGLRPLCDGNACNAGDKKRSSSKLRNTFSMRACKCELKCVDKAGDNYTRNSIITHSAQHTHKRAKRAAAFVSRRKCRIGRGIEGSWGVNVKQNDELHHYFTRKRMCRRRLYDPSFSMLLLSCRSSCRVFAGRKLGQRSANMSAHRVRIDEDRKFAPAHPPLHSLDLCTMNEDGW